MLLFVTWLLITDSGNNHPTIVQVSNTDTSINMLTKEFVRSKISLLKNIILFNLLKDSNSIVLKIEYNMVSKINAFFLVRFINSCIKGSVVSTRDIVEVSAAKAMHKKNKTAKNWPKAILENIAGNVIKAKDGPASISKPNENAAGIINIDENIPTKDPIITIELTDCFKL